MHTREEIQKFPSTVSTVTTPPLQLCCWKKAMGPEKPVLLSACNVALIHSQLVCQYTLSIRAMVLKPLAIIIMVRITRPLLFLMFEWTRVGFAREKVCFWCEPQGLKRKIMYVRSICYWAFVLLFAIYEVRVDERQWIK